MKFLKRQFEAKFLRSVHNIFDKQSNKGIKYCTKSTTQFQMSIVVSSE